MGSEYNNPSKRHYDITMSKRTRKPLSNLPEADAAAAVNNHTKNTNTNTSKARSIFDSRRKADDDDVEEDSSGSSDQHRKSLKQLINYGAKEDDDEGEEERSRDGSGKICSLGHHFSKEQEEMKEKEVQLQLQVVKKNPHGHGEGVRGMMSRYAKVLRHLVKAKREPRMAAASRKSKNHLLRLTMS